MHVHMHINMYIHSGYNWDKHDSPRKLSIQFDSNLPHQTLKVKEVQIQQETTHTGCARSCSLSSTGKADTGVMGSSWQWEGCKPHCILLDTTHRMLDRSLQHVLSYLVIRWTRSLRTTEFCFLSSVIPTEVVVTHHKLFLAHVIYVFVICNKALKTYQKRHCQRFWETNPVPDGEPPRYP